MHISKRFIAGVVAGVIFILQLGGMAPILSVAANAEDLANREETAISKAVDLHFTEEQVAFLEQFVDDNGNHFSVSKWENYLAEGGITTDEEGNLVIYTADKFEHFSLGIQNYLASNGVNLTIKEVRTIVMFENLEKMTLNLKNYLREEYLVYSEVFEVSKPISDIYGKITDVLILFAQKNCQNRMILGCLTSFSKANRNLLLVFDQYIHKYIASLEKTTSGNKPEYLYGLHDVVLIVVGKSPTFPKLPDISLSAMYIAYFKAIEIPSLIRESGGIPIANLSTLAANKEIAEDLVNSYYSSLEYDAANE